MCERYPDCKHKYHHCVPGSSVYRDTQELRLQDCMSSLDDDSEPCLPCARMTFDISKAGDDVVITGTVRCRWNRKLVRNVDCACEMYILVNPFECETTLPNVGGLSQMRWRENSRLCGTTPVRARWVATTVCACRSVTTSSPLSARRYLECMR